MKKLLKWMRGVSDGGNSHRLSAIGFQQEWLSAIGKNGYRLSETIGFQQRRKRYRTPLFFADR